jgi:hypothetical protein
VPLNKDAAMLNPSTPTSHQYDLAWLRLELYAVKLSLALKGRGFNRNQPRAPAGQTGGGRWTGQGTRDGIDGNNPPGARPGTGLPPSRPFEGREAIDLYRAVHGLPESGSFNDESTVAYTVVDGQPILGINSRAPGYTDTDRAAADAMRDTLVAKHPGDMKTENIGHKPNDALYHAEATALLRAARSNSGSLAGKSLDVQVDRRMCGSCEAVLPLLTQELGSPTVTFTAPSGRRRTLRFDRWID